MKLLLELALVCIVAVSVTSGLRYAQPQVASVRTSVQRRRNVNWDNRRSNRRRMKPTATPGYGYPNDPKYDDDQGYPKYYAETTRAPENGCDAGYYSDGDECKICPIGSWSSMYSKKKFNHHKKADQCVPCGDGKTTLKEGATRFDDCVCKMGFMRDPYSYMNKCSPCRLGTYSDTPGAWKCTPCPPYRTTQDQGATNKQDCVCGNGTFLHEEANVCVKCSVNTYRPFNATECLPCPKGTYTMQGGATSLRDCVCPAGLFKHPETGECSLCPVDTFSETPGSVICTDCPAGHTNSAKRTSCVPIA